MNEPPKMATRPPVAYLVNQYPKVSHTFIRREMLTLERQGMEVHRFAIRGWRDQVVDPADLAERERTRYVLQGGVVSLLGGVLAVAWRAPRRFAGALRLALGCASRSPKGLGYHLAYLAEACVLVQWLAAAGIRHLHAHFGTNPAEVAMLTRALGGPAYSFTVHGPEEFDAPQAISLSEKVRHAAFVVAISSYGRSQLYRWARLSDWPRVQVVHCGLDAQFRAGPVPPVPASPRLVCVGRLCEQKGQLLLVAALARVVREGIPVELVLAGDGEMRAEIEAEVQALGLANHVRITGWIGSAAVRDELIAARALVLPSFGEGLPVVIMEAMALARPVLSTYVAGIPELVVPGETGWLFPAGDEAELAEAMRHCLRAAPAALDAMGAKGRQRVLERHDIETEAAKLAALFERSAQQAGTSP